jgi:hypothetical protein
LCEVTLRLRSGQALGYVQASLHFPGLSVLNVVMRTGLRGFQQSGQSHFVTFTCYHRRAYFDLPDVCDLFVQYDRNVRDEREFTKKLRYLHRNPVKRGLVKQPGEWKWSSFRHYALREVGVVEIESEWTARDRETAAQGETARVFLFPG